jgi:CubicO group peptidase (beta-lactamase class C family)
VTEVVRRALRRFRRKHDVPGVVVCTFTAAGPDAAVADGVTSAETQHAMTPETVFRIYSIAKFVTATMIVSLAADGVLDLDAPVDGYLGGLRRRTGTGSDGTTLRHLLSHRSGLLPDAVVHDGLSRDPGGLAAAVRHDYARTPVLARAGEFYGFSNLGVSLAGLVAQEVTGLPFAEVVRQRVFEPLGMGHSTHDPAVAMTYPLAQHHLPGETGLRVDHGAKAGAKHEPSSLCYSTALDLARLGAHHLRARTELGQMHLPHADPRLDVDLRYGLGCTLSPAVQGIRQIGHEGSSGGMWAKLVIDPAAGRGVVWLDNRGEELREQRYRTIRELFDGLGRTDAAGGVSGFGLGLAVEPEAVHGEYVRTGAPPLTVAGRAELELTADRDRAVLVPHQRAVWRSADRYGPGAPPWGPHAGTDRIVLGVTAWRDGSVPVVHLNGLPYVRQEWRKRLRSRTSAG